MLALSRHQDDPFPHGVHDTQCVRISVEELSSDYDIAAYL